MKQHTIRNRLILVGIVVMAAIVGATAVVIHMQRIAAINAFRTATVNLGNGMAAQTTQILAAVDRVLRDTQSALAKIAPDRLAPTLRAGSTHARLADLQRMLQAVDALLLVDANGSLANATRPWPSASADFANSEVFIHFTTGDDQSVFVSRPVTDPVSGAQTVLMARRLEDGHGAFAGLVIAEISLSDLLTFYRLAMPGHRTLYLSRTDGVVLVRDPTRDDEIGRKIPDRAAWHAIVAAGGGTYDAPDYFDGIAVIASIHKLHGLPFVLETSVTEADALSEWYQQRRWVSVGGMWAAIGAFTLLRLFGAQYARLAESEVSLAAKNAELDTAHRQLDATLASLMQGVCLFDNDKRLVLCNRRYGEIFNLPAARLRPGISMKEITELRLASGTFSGGSVDAHLQSIDDILRKGGSADKIIDLGNGRTIAGHIEVLAGRGYVVTHEDITQRLRTEDLLHQAQRLEAVGRLTAGVAHDFNNLLQIVSGALESVAQTDDVDGSEDLRQMVADAADAVAHGGELTQQLLTFSRQQVLRPIHADLWDLVQGMTGLLRHACGESVLLELHHGEGPFPSLVDKTQFCSALLNLAINARDAMPDGGTLAITLDTVSLDANADTGFAAGRYVRVAISDEGEGMGPELLAHVFEPFFTTKTFGAGSGLGLAQVHGFAHQSGGSVSVASTPGSGTTISLLLPCLADGQAA